MNTESEEVLTSFKNSLNSNEAFTYFVFKLAKGEPRAITNCTSEHFNQVMEEHEYRHLGTTYVEVTRTSYCTFSIKGVLFHTRFSGDNLIAYFGNIVKNMVSVKC